MKVPANIIIEGKYTIGKEYMYLDTLEEYQGYYYELNNKFFVGKTFNTNARELVKMDSNKVSKLKTNPKTATYGKISNISLSFGAIKSLVYQGKGQMRYFAKKINTNPILIKELDKENYTKIQKDPIYQVISLKMPLGGFAADPSIIDKAEKEMPGIKAFLQDEINQGDSPST